MRALPSNSRFALVIDDLNQKGSILVDVLKPLKFEVRLALNGIEGVAVLLERIRDKEPIDIVFLDLALKDIPGIETARRLRSANFTGPILGFSIDVSYALAKRAKDAGINHCFLRSTFTPELGAALVDKYLASEN